MNPLTASPAPSRDHYETGLTGEEILPKGKVREFRLWATRPWTAERAIPYILAGGRFNFDIADFATPKDRSRAVKIQHDRDELILARTPHAA